MKITKLHLIGESDEYYIFSVSFKTFFGEKTKTAVKSKSEWALNCYNNKIRKPLTLGGFNIGMNYHNKFY